VLINNAVVSPYQEFRNLSSSHLRQVLALHIRSLTELCYLFMPHMLDHGKESHIVNVSSVGGYAPLPRFAVYTGSKHYVRAFTNMLNYEYQGTNIHVSALYPGGTMTEFLGLAGQQVTQLALKSMMTPEQVAEFAYPAILKGKRVIIPGSINKMAVLVGKLFPFPIAVRIMKFVYDRSIKPAPPTYPL
jgi:short-subunit dehydrogenase